MLKVLGSHPKGQRLERIKGSANYRNGRFENILPTTMSPEGKSSLRVMRDYLMAKKPKDISPLAPVPFVRTDLLSLVGDKPVIVWFGHSSYLIKYLGKTILVDPVFSGYSSPTPPLVKSFEGSNFYGPEHMPDIDMLIITHDHYDHLDYKSILALEGKVRHIYTALGVGEHLEMWGIPTKKISEFDWWESEKVSEQIQITATPARHFSGRTFTRCTSLWASFVLKIGAYQFFIGGDSGYDSQFKVIGEKFGAFDFAFMECGQYNENWPLIHMFPERSAQAAKDLNAKTFMAVHWGKFILSTHSWTEPIERVSLAAEKLELELTTPRIGEPLYLGRKLPQDKWWR